MTKSGKARVLKIMAFGGWGFGRMETDGGGRIRVGDIRRYVGGESRRIALECVGIKGVDAYLNGGDRGPRLHSNETAAAVLGYNPYAPSVFGNESSAAGTSRGAPSGFPTLRSFPCGGGWTGFYAALPAQDKPPLIILHKSSHGPLLFLDYYGIMCSVP